MRSSASALDRSASAWIEPAIARLSESKNMLAEPSGSPESGLPCCATSTPVASSRLAAASSSLSSRAEAAISRHEARVDCRLPRWSGGECENTLTLSGAAFVCWATRLPPPNRPT
eukprot:2020760-Prymnesium_polylepis.1